MNSENTLLKIESMIYVIRGQKVMIDSDLAALYGVETRVLNQAVKRNIERFPEDFMFQLTIEERAQQRSQIVIFDHVSDRKYMPYAFTECGVAMLSSVLNSQKAIQVNISIMRIFMKLRSFLLLENQMSERMNKIEEGTNRLFKVVFERLDSVEEQVTPLLPDKRRKIGIKNKS